MSSSVVRKEFEDHIKGVLNNFTNPEKLVDLTAEFEDLSEVLGYYEVGSMDAWTGIQYVGSDTDINAITSLENNLGSYREDGAILIHVVDIGRLGVHNDIIARGEVIANSLRGRRLANGIVVDEVSPVNFGRGVALQFEGKYVSGTISVGYYRDYSNN